MIRYHHGQPYTLLRTDPHICRDGRETTLHSWISICAKCGDPFTLRTPAKAKKFSPNRRCSRCKRPGSWVEKRT